MNQPAEQIAPEQTPPAPEAMSDEDIFEEEFDRRFGTSPDPDEPAPPADAAPEGTPPTDAAPEGTPPADAAPEGTPPTDAAPEGTPPTDAAPEGTPPAEPPKWYKELSDEARAMFDEANQNLSQLQDQYTSIHGRLAPVQQENARLRSRLETWTPPPAPGQPATTPATPEAFDPKDIPGFSEFSESFPEEAKVMAEGFRQQARQLSHLQGQLGDMSQGLERIQTASSGQQRTHDLDKLSAAHSDWMTIRPSRDFAAWLQYQPPTIARMVDSPNPDDCIYILDRYKQDVALYSQAEATPPAPPAPHDSASSPQAVRDRRQRLRSVPGLDPQPSDVGVPQGNPEEFLSDEDVWDREVERRLRAQRDSQR